MGHNSKLIKVIVVFIIGMFISINVSNNIYADPIETITLVNLSEEEARKNYLLVVPRIVSKDLLEKKLIEQIVVTEDWVAIGTENKVVGVFNTDGSYRYSVAFSIDGIYNIFFDKANKYLTVFVAKANAYFSFDENGQLIQMEERDARRQLKSFKSEPVDGDGCEYYLSTGNKLLDKICFGYPKVMKKDTSGSESVFWDSGSHRFKPQNLFMFFVFMILLIINMKIKGKNKRKKEEEEKKKLFDKFKNLKI